MLNASSQEVLCRWAEERYNVTGITKVVFGMNDGDPYGGCDTCGYGAEPPSVGVLLYGGEYDRFLEGYDEEYVPELINSIVEVATRGN